MTTSEDRRHFYRVLFDRPATMSSGDTTWQCSLIDLSLKGALVSCPAEWRDETSEVTLSFDLSEQHNDEQCISMLMGVRHHEEGVLGLECLQIDLESASLLRRLIELNLGDDELLHRQLEQLVSL